MRGLAVMGFDEKFIMRCMMRHSRELDEFYVLMPGEAIDKVERAFSTLKNFADAMDLSLRRMKLEAKDFESAYSEILSLMEGVDDDLVICASSGMRMFMLATVLAAARLRDRNVLVSVDREDQSGYDEFPLSDVVPPAGLGEAELKILRAVANGAASISEVSRVIGKSYAATWRAVKSLIDKGMLRRIGRKLVLPGRPLWLVTG